MKILQKEYKKLSQKTIDEIVKQMAIASMIHHVELAKMTIEETNRGVLEDKIIKNMFASEYVWDSIKDKKTIGILKEDSAKDYIEIAEPLGVIAGVTPVTNPTSTTIFKSLICVKTANPIIFGFHPGAQKCCVKTAQILRDVAVKFGAPENCIQWIETPSIEATSQLMNHPGVNVVLATGGSAMVKSAYSTGKPALGVGPGNVPCYVEKSADLLQACNDIILSKTFDNGMICASEQSVIVDEDVSEEFERIMEHNKCKFLNEEEIQKLSSLCFKNNRLNPEIVGKTAKQIADMSGIDAPDDVKILICRLFGVGKEIPLSGEKLSPVLGYYIAKTNKEAFEICKDVLEFFGKGHTAVIHSNNQKIIKDYGLEMEAGRIIVNSPSSQGAIGGIYNTNTPSLTLGCGSYGKNSTSLNVSCDQLINIKKIFMRRNNMQWFKLPPKIYFEKNSIDYIETAENINRVFIVTDKTMIELNAVQKITACLKRRNCCYEIFSDVSPDPDVSTVFDGLKMLNKFNPDTIIAFGGGSVIDAAKGIWLFSGDSNIEFEQLRTKFMDIRKRICKFPKFHRNISFIAIPTTSGTGSEVTSFAVITDKEKNIKYPLADYSLTPDVAIIDPQFVMSLPKSAVADTGMDVLTHAIESYVSTMANDYTDGLCIQAVKLVNDYLESSFNIGDSISREKMHNAACIAGMSFTNAFLGLNHSMAHKLGAEFNISHGRANAILLPYVIKYNSSIPTKFACFPKYKNFIADIKYAYISEIIGRNGNTKEESINNLINWINQLNKNLNIPSSLKDMGVDEKEFLDKVDYLSELAHEDQCTGTNPRFPLINEIKQIYLNCYYGTI